MENLSTAPRGPAARSGSPLQHAKAEAASQTPAVPGLQVGVQPPDASRRLNLYAPAPHPRGAS